VAEVDREEAVLETKIRKWGNSLGVRIPKSFAIEADVSEGSTVDVSLVDGNVVLKPVRKPRIDLDELLEAITTENVHEEIDSGESVGREAW